VILRFFSMARPPRFSAADSLRISDTSPASCASVPGRAVAALWSATAMFLALVGHPRLAPALAAMFNEPARAWSLPELARLCNMSRTTFVRHFQERLGRSASDLLTDIRMSLAANESRKPAMSTAAVAVAAGYQSEAAFQRAFKQRMGMTPAHWRRSMSSP
jgi:AraC family transcriptional activator of mtrCDE